MREYVPFPDPGAPMNKIFFCLMFKATFYRGNTLLTGYTRFL